MHHLLLGVWEHHEESAVSMTRRRWWRDARRLIPAKALPVLELVNAAPGYLPGILAPEMSGGSPGRSRRSLDEELEAIRAVPEEWIATDLATFASDTRREPPPRIWQELQHSGTSVMPRLIDAVRALFAACLAADWPDLQRRVDVEIATRGQQMAADGVTATLNSLDPHLSWQDDMFVSVTSTQAPGPDGRGFVFLPNLMTHRINTMINEGRQPFLGYFPRYREPVANPSPMALGKLIGAGKARALRAVGSGCSTGELAARLGVAAPAASEHLTVLREAGLIVSAREGRSVRHRLTELGAGLLAANQL